MSALQRPLLGEVLTRRGALAPQTLAHALKAQSNHHAPLGQILTHEGWLKPKALHEALAEQQQLPFVNLLESPPDASLVNPEHAADYLRLRAVPWRMQGGQMTVATCDLSEALRAWARERYGHGVRFALTSPRDLLWTVQEHCDAALTDASVNRLWNAAPERSAKVTIWPQHRPWLLGGVGALIAAGTLAPGAVLLVLACMLHLVYLATLCLKLVLFAIGESHRRQRRKEKKPPALPDAALPVYTLLVPLYQEAAGMERLADALRALDYPKAKLDVKLIVEADDHATIEAAKRVSKEGMFEIVRVPFSLPRTKPKACNYALAFARGEMVAIYDAEDAPDAQQLREAAAYFAASQKHVTCLQARLNYYNHDDTLLTRLFAVEYAAWFDAMLFGLERLGAPIPLGGTSNHLPLAALRALGEWDPYNVTEDADLGIRIAASGGRTRVLDSLTEEEAPGTLPAWIVQRSRWIKGYLQTWFVHMRTPRLLLTTLGWRGFFGFQLFIGGPAVVFLTTPFLWVGSLAWVLWPGSFHAPAALLLGGFAAISLADALLIHFIIAAFVLRRKARHWQWKRRDVIVTLCAFPFYWLLHSLASFRAVWQLASRPHHWDKTAHGVGKTIINQLVI